MALSLTVSHNNVTQHRLITQILNFYCKCKGKLNRFDRLLSVLAEQPSGAVCCGH